MSSCRSEPGAGASRRRAHIGGRPCRHRSGVLCRLQLQRRARLPKSARVRCRSLICSRSGTVLPFRQSDLHKRAARHSKSSDRSGDDPQMGTGQTIRDGRVALPQPITHDGLTEVFGRDQPRPDRPGVAPFERDRAACRRHGRPRCRGDRARTGRLGSYSPSRRNQGHPDGQQVLRWSRR